MTNRLTMAVGRSSRAAFRRQIRAAIFAWILAEVPIVATAADFNGDGFEDLPIGVTNEKIAGHYSAGAVQVFNGSAAGLTAGGFWNANSNDVKLSASDFDSFGSSLAASDFNGDGFDDLAVGVPYKYLQFYGAVQVFYGQGNGLQARSPDDQVWTQDTSGVIGANGPIDRFGAALASCNFNGDAFPDLAIGVPSETYDNQPAGALESGAVNVLYGSTGGLSASLNQFWSRADPDVLGTADFFDYFGAALACGDFNGDGFDDLAIGVPNDDPSDVEDAGSVSVISGSHAGLQATGSGGPDDTILRSSSPGQADYMGTALAVCDFNGDGFDDLAIGVPDRDVGGASNAGAVSVRYGFASGLGISGTLWDQNSRGVRERAEAADYFGYSIACNDFNHDGYADLAVGVPGEDDNEADAGVVQILFGSPGGIQATSPDDQLWSQDSSSVLDAEEQGDAFGGGLWAGDFDHDNFSDLAIGVPCEGIGDRFSVGAVNVLYGSTGGLSTSRDQFWNQDSVHVPDAAEGFDTFGTFARPLDLEQCFYFSFRSGRR